MLQSIPTRIAGANILRHTASRRNDGSSVRVRRVTPTGHAQLLPHEELVTADYGFTCEPSFTRSCLDRTVRCLQGELFVCIIDVRPDSPTFGHWQSLCLMAGDGRQIAIPTGVACGWQVLSKRATTEVRASRDVDANQQQWLRWDDRDLALDWPQRPRHLASHLRASRHLRSIPHRCLPQLHASVPADRQSANRKSANKQSANRQSANRQSETRQSETRQSETRQSADRQSADRQSGSRRSAAAIPAPAPGQPRRAVSSQRARTTSAASSTNSIRPVPEQGTTRERELILVIGSSGQLGRDLCRALQGLGTVVGACRTPDRQSVLPVPVGIDISRPASLRQAIRQVRPTLIVNAAGLTDLDQAESQPRLAQLVNATAPALIAEEAARIGAGVVHFCSGMVFDGSGERPWRESDRANPQNQYARTKLIGTEAVLSSNVPHLVLRCGWLYSTHGDNYVRRLIDALAYRNSVTLANNHLGTPTSTNFLAGLTAELLGRAHGQPGQAQRGSVAQWLSQHGGLYHASTLGSASKLIVGDQILATCRQHALPIVLQNLQGRSLDELPTLATIPANCALDPTRLAMKFKLELPRWQTDLNQQIDLMLGAHSLALSSVA